MPKETTTITDLFAILDLFDELGCAYWLDGGWGVDALVGHQTREHRDIDIDFDAEYLSAVQAKLAELGFTVETDWLPNRIEYHSDRLGYLDIHPFELMEDGTSRQANLEDGWYDFTPAYFGTGTFEGRTIPCISALGQKVFHSGYEPRDVDRHDLALIETLLP